MPLLDGRQPVRHPLLPRGVVRGGQHPRGDQGRVLLARLQRGGGQGQVPEEDERRLRRASQRTRLPQQNHLEEGTEKHGTVGRLRRRPRQLLHHRRERPGRRIRRPTPKSRTIYRVRSWVCRDSYSF